MVPGFVKFKRLVIFLAILLGAQFSQSFGYPVLPHVACSGLTVSDAVHPMPWHWAWAPSNRQQNKWQVELEGKHYKVQSTATKEQAQELLTFLDNHLFDTFAKVFRE